MSKNRVLSFSSAQLLAGIGYKIEFRSKSPDSNWWPLLAPQHLDRTDRFEYRLAPEESCWQNALARETQKKLNIKQRFGEIEHAKRMAASKAAEFYQRWKEKVSEITPLINFSPRFLLTPFTYEDRDRLRNKWITQPGIKYECQIIGVCTEGVRIVERLGTTIFIDFHTLARDWRFIDQTFCGKSTNLTASMDPASNQDAHTTVTIFKTTK